MRKLPRPSWYAAPRAPRARRAASSLGVGLVLVGAGAAGLLMTAAGGSPAGPRGQEPVVLTSGRAATLSIDPEEGVAHASIEVPVDATGLRITTADSSADIELYLAYDREPYPWFLDFDVAADNTWYEESLFVEYSDAVALESGTWTLAIVPAGPTPPDVVVSTSITAELVRPAEVEGTLAEVASFGLRREHGLRALVEYELPREARRDEEGEYLVEVYCPSADVDVTVGGRGTFNNLLFPDASSYSYRSYERLVVDPTQLRRHLVVNVVAYQESEVGDDLPVSVLVRRVLRGDPTLPDGDLCPTPVLPAEDALDAAPPFKTAARSTVAIVGANGTGSGSVVSASGYVLTCAHILVGADGPSRFPPVAVGFSEDLSRPPRPDFGAEVVHFRQDLDLALLRITGDLLGRPLPAEIEGRLPVLRPAPTRPRLGAEIVNLGFPGTGGSGSMVTLTMTRGIVAGFAREVEGVLLKTDAEVHSGDSGGPFLDTEGRLVGVAIASLADESKGGGIGYVVPVELVPEEWRELIGW